MAQHKSKAVWRGGLKDGNGAVELGSGLFKAQYSFQSRFESGPGTNPEELIGAAHAACFSMALAANLERDGFAITTIDLDTLGRVQDIDEEEFLRQAEVAKDTCPVSQVLKGANISLTARLEPAYSPV